MDPVSVCVLVTLASFGGTILAYASRDLIVDIVWPWLRGKWAARRNPA
jgi:hypothetical protein